MSTKYQLNHLRELESESIFVLREVAAQFENPVLLFSGGKDSILMVHLAMKAFHPAKIPFTLLHVDTGHNFQEALDYRDALVEKLGAKLVVGSVQEGRDEEKARAKERFFSHRDEFGQWDPKNQRPELWNLFNGRKQYGEHFRIFPISNWTELDVWQYLAMEKVDLPSLYFAHDREVIHRDGMLLATEGGLIPVRPEEKVETLKVRCRTIGDITTPPTPKGGVATHTFIYTLKIFLVPPLGARGPKNNNDHRKYRTPTLHYRRLRRRRQINPHRPPPLRFKIHL